MDWALLIPAAIVIAVLAWVIGSHIRAEWRIRRRASETPRYSPKPRKPFADIERERRP